MHSCRPGPPRRASRCVRDAPAPDSEPTMNAIAESYVKLVLAVGQHDANYVDAYYGPPEWKAWADSAKLPLDEIGAGPTPRSRAWLTTGGPTISLRFEIATCARNSHRFARACACSRETASPSTKSRRHCTTRSLRRTMTPISSA